MAETIMTKEQFGDVLKSISDRQDSIASRQGKVETAISGLLKAAQMPASKAGVSPEEWLNGQFKDGMAIFDTGGHTRHKGHRSCKSKSIGKGERSDNHRDRDFGHLLKALHDFHDDRYTPPDERMKAGAICKSFGMQRGSYRTINAVDMVVKSDMLEQQGPMGGYLVPQQFEERVFQVEAENSIVDNYAQMYQLVSRTLVIPALDQVKETFTGAVGQSNLYGGVRWYWAAEGASRQQTNPKFRNVILNCNELSFYAGATNTLLQDVAGLEAMLARIFSEAVAFGVDYSCFRGTGAGQPLGMQNAGCTINVTRLNANQITIQDLENIYQYVFFPSRGEDLVWVAHPSCTPWILRLNDQSGYTSGTGRRLFVPIDQGAQADIEQSDGPRGFGDIWGKKLLLSEKMPPLGSTGDIGLYNMNAYAQGRRMDIEIMVSPHVQFLQNSSVWRVVLRFDGQPLFGNKITWADQSTYASPFLLLH